MIGEVVAYAASRATSGAVESISRYAVWIAAGTIVLLLGLIFGVMAAFWTIEPIYGSVQSAAMIAVVCVVAALLCFVVPGVVQFMQRRRSKRKAQTVGPVAETVEAVNAEAVQAVDYFGPLKVMLTAFMFGLGAGKQLRRTL